FLPDPFVAFFITKLDCYSQPTPPAREQHYSRYKAKMRYFPSPLSRGTTKRAIIRLAFHERRDNCHRDRGLKTPPSPRTGGRGCHVLFPRARSPTGAISPSGIEEADVQRVVLNKIAPWLHDIAHQRGEHLVCFVAMIDAHLQQRARLWIERGFPELFGVHLAKALVALDRQAAVAEICHLRHQIERGVDDLALVLVDKDRRLRIDGAKLVLHEIERARLGGVDQIAVDDPDFGHAAHLTAELEAEI